MPDVLLLSNGRYHALLTGSGGGYSTWNGLALTRWREDAVLEAGGTFCCLRDSASGVLWSTTVQPTLHRPQACHAQLGAGQAQFEREDDGIAVHSTVLVAPDDDMALRQVCIRNRSGRVRQLSATSFAEIVLAPAATDAAHLAFSKLFVETRIDPALHTIFATRRPSTPQEERCWLFHRVLIDTGAPHQDAADAPTTLGAVSYETDRVRSIGRGRTAQAPLALQSDAPLSGSDGAVLDAVAAIGVPFTLAPGAGITLTWLTGVAPSQEACTALAQKYADAPALQPLLEHAATYRQATLSAGGAGGAGGADEADARLIQLLQPPFDTSQPSPGYIQGYVPGVRENGGQYTHAAVWVAMAFAALGDAERAWEMLALLNPVHHGGSAAVVLDGQALEGDRLALLDDRLPHTVQVTVWTRPQIQREMPPCTPK